MTWVDKNIHELAPHSHNVARKLYTGQQYGYIKSISITKDGIDYQLWNVLRGTLANHSSQLSQICMLSTSSQNNRALLTLPGLFDQRNQKSCTVNVSPLNENLLDSKWFQPILIAIDVRAERSINELIMHTISDVTNACIQLSRMTNRYGEYRTALTSKSASRVQAASQDFTSERCRDASKDLNVHLEELYQIIQNGAKSTGFSIEPKDRNVLIFPFLNEALKTRLGRTWEKLDAVNRREIKTNIKCSIENIFNLRITPLDGIIKSGTGTNEALVSPESSTDEFKQYLQRWVNKNHETFEKVVLITHSSFLIKFVQELFHQSSFSEKQLYIDNLDIVQLNYDNNSNLQSVCILRWPTYDSTYCFKNVSTSDKSDLNDLNDLDDPNVQRVQRVQSCDTSNTQIKYMITESATSNAVTTNLGDTVDSSQNTSVYLMRHCVACHNITTDLLPKLQYANSGATSLCLDVTIKEMYSARQYLLALFKPTTNRKICFGASVIFRAQLTMAMLINILF